MVDCNPIEDEEIKRLTGEYLSKNGIFDKILKTKLSKYYLNCGIDKTKIDEKINEYYAEHRLNETTSAAAPPAARPPVPAAARPPVPAARPPIPAAAPSIPPISAAPAAASDTIRLKRITEELMKDYIIGDPSSAPLAPEIITPPPLLRPSLSISASLRSTSSKSASLRPTRQNLPSELLKPKKVVVILGTKNKSTKPSGNPLILRKKQLPCDSLNNDKEYYNLRRDIDFKVPPIDSANGFFTKNNKLFQIYSNYQSQNDNLKRFKEIYYNYEFFLLDDIQKIHKIMSEINKKISDIKTEAKYKNLLFINEEIQRNFNKIYSIQNEITDDYDCELPKLNQYIIIDILQTYFLDYYQMLILLIFNNFLNWYLSSYENKDYNIIKIIDELINLNKNNIYLYVKYTIEHIFTKNVNVNRDNFYSKLLDIIHEYGDKNTLIKQLSDNIYNYLTKKTSIKRIINILETEYKKEAIYNIEKRIYDLFYSNKSANHTIKYIVNEKNYEANYSVYSKYSNKIEPILDDENDKELFELLITNECVCKKIYHIYDILCEHTTKNTIKFIKDFIINDENIKIISPFICDTIKEYNQYYNALQNIDYDELIITTTDYSYANELKSFGKLIIFNKFFYNIDITDIDNESYYRDLKEKLTAALKNIGVIYDDKKYHDIIINLKKIMISDILFSYIITYIQNKLMYNMLEIFKTIGLKYNKKIKEQKLLEISIINDTKEIKDKIHICIIKIIKTIDKILDDKKRNKYIQKKLKNNRDHINNVISMFNTFLLDKNNYNKPTNSFKELYIKASIDYNESFKLNLEYIKKQLTDFSKKLPKQSRLSKIKNIIWRKGGKKVSLVKTKERIVVCYENKKYKRNILIRKNKKYVKINNKYMRLI
jgi:hypothetical protein